MEFRRNTRAPMSQIYVFGNSFASIVAVSELAKGKKEFLWIQDGLNVDGIWRGINHKNRILDLGMINFEFDVRHPNSSADLDTYSQYEINDCARFSDSVLNYVRRYSDVKVLPKILIYENNAIHHDHLLSNDFSHLDRFRDLAFDGTENPIGMHPSRKYTSNGKELLLDISYGEYVKKYFGLEIADKLFLPWAHKLIGDNVENTNTFRHRAAWLPLPYPETIFEAISGNLTDDYAYSFHYPIKDTFSEFVNQIFEGLNGDQGIEILQSSDLSDQELKTILNSDSKVFWGSKLEVFLRIFDQYPKHEIREFRNLINVDLYEVQSGNDFSSYVFLNNDSTDTAWYRLTVLPNVELEDGLQIAIVESRGPKNPSLDSDHFSHLRIKIKTHIKSVQGVPVFLTLNGEQYRNYESWHKLLVDNFPSINFGGGASFAYSTTFSDQVIQGIRFARKECEDVIG